MSRSARRWRVSSVSDSSQRTTVLAPISMSEAGEGNRAGFPGGDEATMFQASVAAPAFGPIAVTERIEMAASIPNHSVGRLADERIECFGTAGSSHLPIQQMISSQPAAVDAGCAPAPKPPSTPSVKSWSRDGQHRRRADPRDESTHMDRRPHPRPASPRPGTWTPSSPPTRATKTSLPCQ
jgi:hypothetical protein